MQQIIIKTPSVRLFNRVLKNAVPGIASTEERFTLENGYYVNQAETIIIQSTNATGKFFKKLPQIHGKSSLPTEKETHENTD